jgi:hypothetical protein
MGRRLAPELGQEGLEGVNNGYVILEGTFDAQNCGHRGMWAGSIRNVTRLEPWGKPV